MARNIEVERMLLAWAEWLKVGDGSGYPMTSVLHPHWSPPATGQTPTMKVASPSHVRRMHAAVLQLSDRLQETLVVHYVMNLPLAQQAERLRCQPSTVWQRIVTAHRLLQGVLHN